MAKRRQTAAEAEEKRTRQKVDSYLRDHVATEGFLCPECRQRKATYVVNPQVGHVCTGCDADIRLIG